jgi:hypothetical protein
MGGYKVNFPVFFSWPPQTFALFNALFYRRFSACLAPARTLAATFPGCDAYFV